MLLFIVCLVDCCLDIARLKWDSLFLFNNQRIGQKVWNESVRYGCVHTTAEGHLGLLRLGQIRYP